MSKPIVVDKFPAMVDLRPGKHRWCACGKCAEALCAAEHDCAPFETVEFEVKHSRRYKLCQCKQTKKAPYCDNAHCSLPSG